MGVQTQLMPAELRPRTRTLRHPGTAPPAQNAPVGLSMWLSLGLGPELRASRCWCKASSPEPRLGRSGSNRLPSSTTRLRRSSSWVTLHHHGMSHAGPRAWEDWERGSPGTGHSRGVGVLQEAELVSLAIWAQRLHDRQDAGRGEGRCRVEGWWGQGG